MMRVVYKQMLFEVLAVLVLSLVLGLAITALRPQGLGLLLKKVPTSPPSAEGLAGNAITLDAALQYERAGAVLFADARARPDYLAGHIAGARSLPLMQFDEWINDFLTTTASNMVIITYCEGGHCPLARELAERLALVGFEKVYYLDDGWGQWQARGLPVAEGQAPPVD